MSILDISQWRSTHQEVSLAGLSVLNELLYLQKSLPHSVTLMTGINALLDQHNSSKQQSEMYIDKFRELLRLYAFKYWPKMLQESIVLEGFLKSLYFCTVFRKYLRNKKKRLLHCVIAKKEYRPLILYISDMLTRFLYYRPDISQICVKLLHVFLLFFILFSNINIHFC